MFHNPSLWYLIESYMTEEDSLSSTIKKPFKPDSIVTKEDCQNMDIIGCCEYLEQEHRKYRESINSMRAQAKVALNRNEARRQVSAISASKRNCF